MLDLATISTFLAAGGNGLIPSWFKDTVNAAGCDDPLAADVTQRDLLTPHPQGWWRLDPCRT